MSRLALDGFSVVINYSRKADAAQKLAGEIVAAGGKAAALKADVRNLAEMADLFKQATSTFGGVIFLVNNAGIMKLAPLADTDDALFDEQIAINLKGTFNGLRLAAQQLRDGGRVVSLRFRRR